MPHQVTSADLTRPWPACDQFDRGDRAHLFGLRLGIEPQPGLGCGHQYLERIDVFDIRRSESRPGASGEAVTDCGLPRGLLARVEPLLPRLLVGAPQLGGTQQADCLSRAGATTTKGPSRRTAVWMD